MTGGENRNLQSFLESISRTRRRRCRLPRVAPRRASREAAPCEAILISILDWFGWAPAYTAGAGSSGSAFLRSILVYRPFAGMLFGSLLMIGCGLQLEEVVDPGSKADAPSFLSVSVKLTSAADLPGAVVSAVDFSAVGCSKTPAFQETFQPQSARSRVFNFSSADKDCLFEFGSFAIQSSSGVVAYEPVVASYLSADSPRLVQRYVPVNGQGPALLVDISSSYNGAFDENESVVALLGFERTNRGSGIELQRVDLTEEDPASGDVVGVGLRIESMVGRRSRGGQGILALEVRFSCLELRDVQNCFGRDLTAYQFRFIQSDTTPDLSVLEGAWNEARLVTRIKPENLFGNGIYALVSTPTPLPNDNRPATTLWLLVRSQDRVSAFQVNTAGIAVFD